MLELRSGLIQGFVKKPKNKDAKSHKKQNRLKLHPNTVTNGDWRAGRPFTKCRKLFCPDIKK
jgi:hypothetical protein